MRSGAVIAGTAIAGIGTEQEAKADQAVTSNVGTVFLRSSLDPIKFSEHQPLSNDLKNLVDDILAVQRKIATALSSISEANIDSNETRDALAGAEKEKRSLWDRIASHFEYDTVYSAQNYDSAIVYDLPRMLAPCGIAAFVKPVLVNDIHQSRFAFAEPMLSLYTIRDIQSYRVEGGDREFTSIAISASDVYPGSPTFTIGGEMPAATGIYGNIFTNADGVSGSFDYLVSNTEKARTSDQSQMEARGLSYVASSPDQVGAALGVAKTFVFKIISQTEFTKSDVLDPLLTHEAGHIANAASAKQSVPQPTSDPLEYMESMQTVNIRSEITARLYGLRHTRRQDIEILGLLEECRPQDKSESSAMAEIAAGWMVDQLVAEIAKDQSLIDPKFKNPHVQTNAQAVLSLPRLLADNARLNQILDRLIDSKAVDTVDLSRYFPEARKARPGVEPQKTQRSNLPAKTAIGVGAGLTALGLNRLLRLRNIGMLESGLREELVKSMHRRRAEDLIADLDLRKKIILLIGEKEPSQSLRS